MRKNKAFTLIELLVVISIIAMLMAILMPALDKAKEQAKSVICLSNLKQWGMIWKLYTDDHNSEFSDGRYYPKEYTNSKTYPRGQWIVGLRSYLDSSLVKILLCPSASKEWSDENVETGATNYAYSSGEWLIGVETELASYGFNCWAYNTDPTKSPLRGYLTANHWRKLDNVKQAGRVPLMGDSAHKGGWPTYADGSGAISDDTLPPEFPIEIPPNAKTGRGMHNFTMARHLNRMNMLFMDLSVDKVDLKHLWELKWHREFDTRGYIKSGGDWDRQAPWMARFKE